MTRSVVYEGSVHCVSVVRLTFAAAVESTGRIASPRLQLSQRLPPDELARRQATFPVGRRTRGRRFILLIASGQTDGQTDRRVATQRGSESCSTAVSTINQLATLVRGANDFTATPDAKGLPVAASA